MKKTLNLQQLIDLQGTIETIISSTQYEIITNYAFLKSEGSNSTDVVGLYDKYALLLDQLNIVKLAKDKANRKKSKLGKTNQELILELSNLKRLDSLNKTLFKQKLMNNKGKWNFHIPKMEMEDNIATVSDRISEIKLSMTEFNKSHTVKIIVHKELNLL